MTAGALHPFPDGWFRIVDSAALRPGAVVTRRVWGRELVVFRSERGTAAVVDAHCPHLGAHLGHGGRVTGEALRCPFHGLCFDTEGRCVATHYPGDPPAKLRLGTWPSVERHGFVFAYLSHARRPPPWQLPDEDASGYSAPVVRTLQLRGHVQDTSENAVDLRHLSVVHGYRAIREPEHRIDGPRLWSRFSFERAHPLVPFATVTSVFDTDVWGLGYSRTDLSVRQLGMRARLHLLATPIEPDTFEFTISFRSEVPPAWSRGRLAPPDPSRGTGWPWRVYARGLGLVAMRAIVHDVMQDRLIWEHKAHVDPPGLIRGDGPIGAFRRWARQFYPAADGSPRGADPRAMESQQDGQVELQTGERTAG